MRLYKVINIDQVWDNICKHEGDTFSTVRNIPFGYVVYDDYILINNDKKRKISKSALNKALNINEPTPSKILKEGIWGPSYVYGIITDHRIL